MSLKTIFINEDESSYKKLIKDTTASLQERSILPFFGAGISISPPACLPSAESLVKPLVAILWQTAQNLISKEKLNATDIDLARNVLVNARLERLLDALYYSYGQKSMEYISVLNGNVWNYNHAAIAALAQNNLLPSCITLNFDLLIEQATGTCEVECPLAGTRFLFGSGIPKLHIIKPHGSFTPGSKPYQNITTILSQIGQEPSNNNIKSITSALELSPELFVAGYSNNDWDIFPILVRKSHLMKKVLWVQYADNNVVKARNLSKLPSYDYRILSTHIIPWLSDLEIETTLLIGNVQSFLTDVINNLSLNVIDNNNNHLYLNKPNANIFALGENFQNLDSVKTALALAHLIQITGNFSENLLLWLKKNPIIINNTQLAYRVEDLTGHMYHTYGYMDDAICHTRRVIELKNQIHKPIENDTVWLGYEYLCKAKRPNPLRPLELLKLPFYVMKGIKILNKGIALTDPPNRRNQIMRAAFYKIDLLHSWGNLCMLFGTKFIRLIKTYFLWIEKLYRNIQEQSDLMESTYYWLRHLEAKLLSETPININERKKIEKKLEELARVIHKPSSPHSLLRVASGRMSLNRAQIGVNDTHES